MKFFSMSREEFLKRRGESMRAHEAGELDCLCENPIFADCEEIVMDPGEDVICDVCNCDVEDELLHLNDWGLYCETCWRKYDNQASHNPAP